MMLSCDAANHAVAQNSEIHRLFHVILSNHYRIAAPCFTELEQAGVFLGNGGFSVAAVQQPIPEAFSRAGEEAAGAIASAIREKLRTPSYHIFDMCGRLYLLLCYPRMTDSIEARQAISSQLTADLTEIQASLESLFSGVSFLVSGVFQGESSIFLAANSLEHAMEYYAFLEEQPPVVLLNPEQQLHGAFVEDFYVYRKLSNQAVDLLTKTDCDLAALTERILSAILKNSSPSIESVHHHVQMFILTFTELLSTSGLVHASFISRSHIVRRSMIFETRSGLQATMTQILTELRRQYLALTAVGKQHQIQSVREYVLRHITDKALSVSGVAAHFHVASSQLTSQFQRYYAISLHHFIQAARLQQAKLFISAHPDWNLTEVAEAAGYTDISTMYRAFRKLDGTTPGKLKQNRRTQGDS